MSCSMTIKTLMVDLQAARQLYWEHQHLASYQDIWTEIRRVCAEYLRALLNGAAPREGNVYNVYLFGTIIARFEIK